MAGEGFKGWMSFVPEVTFGTNPGSPQYARLRADSVKMDPSVKRYPGISGPGRRKVFHGRKIIGGDLEPEVHFEGMGQILRHAFGGYAFLVDTPEPGANTHTFTLAADLPEGMTNEIARGDVDTNEVWLYTGGMIDQFNIMADTEDFVRWIMSMVYQDEAEDTARSGAPTFPTDRPILFHYMGTVTLAGTAAIPVKTANVLINNNMQKDRYFMKQLMSRPKRASGGREVTGQLVTEYENNLLYAKFKNETEGTLSEKWTSTENIGATATPYSMELTAPAVHLVGQTPNNADDGPIDITYDFWCLDETAELELVLINGEGTYA